MKTIIGSAALFFLLLASSCASKPDMTKIKVGPGNTVSWEDAKAIINEGDVEIVFQSHSLEVRIYMADDTTYTTTEPQIDDVIRWVEECGKRDSVAIMTE